MSTRDRYLINIRLRCTRDPRLTGDAYDLTDPEVAEEAILDPDDGLTGTGTILHDATEWKASREGGDPAGRLVLFCQVEIEADSEEQALEALDQATVFVPGYAVEEWSTVPAEIDAD